MSGREKTILLQNSGFIQRPVEREQKAAENSFYTQSSIKSKSTKQHEVAKRTANLNLLKNVGKKNSTCFWGPGRKVFLGRFYYFWSSKPHITSSI